MSHLNSTPARRRSPEGANAARGIAVASLMALALALTGCSDDAEQPLSVTATEIGAMTPGSDGGGTASPAETLSTGGTTAAPTSAGSPTAASQPSGPAAADGAPQAPGPLTAESQADAVQVVRDSGLDAFVALISEDPDLIGEKGEDLVKELRKVQDKPDERRISRASERITEWREDGEVDPEVADAALLILADVAAQGGASASEDGGDDSGRDEDEGDEGDDGEHDDD